MYGAQDLSPHDSGAYTGDISGVDAREAGLPLRGRGTLGAPGVPHETDELVNGKVRAALRNGIDPDPVRRRGFTVREAGEHVPHSTAELKRRWRR